MASKNNLTAVQIKNAGVGKLQDGGGLILDKTADGGKWIYRYSFEGRRREMGLGTLSDVSLAEARRSRDKWAALILSGKDPISERDRVRAAEKAELDRVDPTLEELIAIQYEKRKPYLKRENGIWMSPMRNHLLHKLGNRRVSTITDADLVAVLTPIWRTMKPTAVNVFRRTRQAFQTGRMLGYSCDPSTVDKAAYMMGDLQYVPENHPNVHWQDIPELWSKLDPYNGVHQAIQFAILTVTRADSVVGARFDEIDGSVWTIPIERVKGRKGFIKPFRVPLSSAAMQIVEKCSETSSTTLFRSRKSSMPLSSSTPTMALHKLGYAAVLHGFRATFRTWVQENRTADYDVAETCLNHVVGSRAARAYTQSDMLDERRIVMDKWSAYVTGTAVVQLQQKAS